MIRHHAIPAFPLFFFFLLASVHAQQQVDVGNKRQLAFPGRANCFAGAFDAFPTSTDKSSSLLISHGLVITEIQRIKMEIHP